MAQKRRRFSSEFTKKVALEAPGEQDTVQQIAARHKVHPNQVSTWKRQAVEGLSGVFEVGSGCDGRIEPGPAVRAGRGEPFVAVLQSGGKERGELGAGARDRRGAPEVSIPRGLSDALAPAPWWRGCGREPRAPADAGDGVGRGAAAAADEFSGPGAQGVPLPAG